MDFAFQNNLRKRRFYEYATGGYNQVYINTAEGETYDAKNRIVRKDFADATGTQTNIRLSERFYTTYKYK
jgi:hypothetical protein